MKKINSKIKLSGILRFYARENMPFGQKKLTRTNRFKTRSEKESGEICIRKIYKFEFEDGEDFLYIPIEREIFLKGPFVSKLNLETVVVVSYGKDIWNSNGGILKFELHSTLLPIGCSEEPLGVPLASVSYVWHKKLGLMRYVKAGEINWRWSPLLDGSDYLDSLDSFKEIQESVFWWLDGIICLEEHF